MVEGLREPWRPPAGSPNRRRAFLLGAAVGVIALGLVLRTFGYAIGLPFAVVKYGGSLLWGSMVYLLIASLAVRRSQRTVAGLSLALAIIIELSRLCHVPWLDSFRLSTAGALLLGRVFSPWNILAYGTGITLAAGLQRSYTDPGRQAHIDN